jgi:hypothetical protein
LTDTASSPPFHLMASPLNLVADQGAFLKALRAQLADMAAYVRACCQNR